MRFAIRAAAESCSACAGSAALCGSKCTTPARASTVEQQGVIFDEFRRGEDQSGQGLGLGLAIADRIADLLHTPLQLRSRQGAGSVFSVTAPWIAKSLAPSANPRASLAGTKVLLVDNDPQALAALKKILEGWGCEVAAAHDAASAEAALAGTHAELWLFDFHLDHGETGVGLHEKLLQRYPGMPRR